MTWAVDWCGQRQEKSVYIPQQGTDEGGCVFATCTGRRGGDSMLIISVTSLLTQDCYQELS